MVTDAEVLKRWKYIAQEDEKLLILIGGPDSRFNLSGRMEGLRSPRVV